ncbi:hypothetical protein M2394_004166 [Pseudomonas sp. BIGb0164]|nr:hypothetical protein [Pseudomonas sp. BIGb0164]
MLAQGLCGETVDHHTLGNRHQKVPGLFQFSGHGLSAFGQQQADKGVLSQFRRLL